MLLTKTILFFPLCLALSSTPVFSASSYSLLTGVLFAKNELENATKTERDGVISLCHEASINEYASEFWNNLSMDCTLLVANLMTEIFGNSITSSCMSEMQISDILRASDGGPKDGLTIEAIMEPLAMGAVMIASQKNYTTFCVDAMKKIYFSMPYTE